MILLLLQNRYFHLQLEARGNQAKSITNKATLVDRGSEEQQQVGQVVRLLEQTVLGEEIFRRGHCGGKVRLRGD